MNDAYAEWKQKSGFYEAEANKWKSDLAKGQTVVAVQDIEYSDYSSRCVSAGTKGRVIRCGTQIHEWGIRWDGKRDTWYCVYDASDIKETATSIEDVCWDAEFIPLELWNRLEGDAWLADLHASFERAIPKQDGQS
jgi:hypothetical protein